MVYWFPCRTAVSIAAPVLSSQTEDRGSIKGTAWPFLGHLGRFPEGEGLAKTVVEFVNCIPAHETRYRTVRAA